MRYKLVNKTAMLHNKIKYRCIRHVSSRHLYHEKMFSCFLTNKLSDYPFFKMYEYGIYQ